MKLVFMKKSTNNLIINPQEFFQEKISQTVSEHSFLLDQEIEYYMVNLLCEFIEPDKFFKVDEEIDIFETPLAFILQKALDSTADRQIVIYKLLGDTSLYMGGFFQDFFNNKPYDIKYFMSLGTLAYKNVANLLKQKNPEKTFFSLYNNISQSFPTMIDVISHISASSFDVKNSQSVLELYDRWSKSDSEILRKKIEESGISPSLLKSKKQ